MQTDATLLHVPLHPFARPVTCLWGVVAQSLKPLKLLTRNFHRSVAHYNVGSVWQLFQHCWGQARAFHMVSVEFTKSYILPRMHSRSQHCWPNNVGSCRTLLAQQCWELLHPCWQWWAPSLKSCVKKAIMFLPLLAMYSRCDP